MPSLRDHLLLLRDLLVAQEASFGLSPPSVSLSSADGVSSDLQPDLSPASLRWAQFLNASLLILLSSECASSCFVNEYIFFSLTTFTIPSGPNISSIQFICRSSLVSSLRPRLSLWPRTDKDLRQTMKLRIYELRRESECEIPLDRSLLGLARSGCAPSAGSLPRQNADETLVRARPGTVRSCRMLARARRPGRPRAAIAPTIRTALAPPALSRRRRRGSDDLRLFSLLLQQASRACSLLLHIFCTAYAETSSSPVMAEPPFWLRDGTSAKSRRSARQAASSRRILTAQLPSARARQVPRPCGTLPHVVAMRAVDGEREPECEAPFCATFAPARTSAHLRPFKLATLLLLVIAGRSVSQISRDVRC
ncbi:hypothetical protein C8R47DRAFT_1082129 [Mycena vitilis]|nr:hypothetical protein C8R47DRAFT_1082129 [Mycena vitilis]